MRPFLAIAILLIFGLVPAHVSGQTNPDERVSYRFTLLGKTWSLDISIPPYEGNIESIKTDRYSFSGGPEPRKDPKGVSRLQVSMIPAGAAVNALVLRDHFKKASNLTGIKTMEHSGIPILVGKELPLWSAGYPGLPSKYSFNAFWVRDGIAIELMTSFFGKANEVDVQFFYSIVDSIKFIETTQPSGSFDYYQLGRAQYIQKNFQRASEYFSVALEFEGKQRQLPLLELRNLVVESADAYGAQRKIEDLRSTFEFGASADPTYHLFNWGLARYYAVKGDKAKALAELEKMYRNMPKEDRKPKPVLMTLGRVRIDPNTASVFKDFLKDPEFRRAVKEMQER